MGKPQKTPLQEEQADSLIKKHLSLVNALFKNLPSLNVSSGFRVAVIFPEYKTKKGWKSVNRGSFRFHNADLKDYGDLHWSRKDSIINRLIYIFGYNPR